MAALFDLPDQKPFNLIIRRIILTLYYLFVALSAGIGACVKGVSLQALTFSVVVVGFSVFALSTGVLTVYLSRADVWRHPVRYWLGTSLLLGVGLLLFFVGVLGPRDA